MVTTGRRMTDRRMTRTWRTSPGRTARRTAAVGAGLSGTIALFQLALALGVPWGKAAYGGAAAELPRELRVSSAVAVVIWPLIGLVILRRAGHRVWAPLPDAALPGATWAIVALSGVAVVLNTITRSWLERILWLPVAVVLFLSTVVVASGTRPSPEGESA